MKKPNRNRTTKVILFLVVLAGILLFLFISSEKRRHDAEERRRAEIRSNIENYVKVNLNDYRVNALGGIQDAYVSVENQTEFGIDELEVELYYYKAVGDIYKTEKIDFKGIPAHSKISKRAPDSDRGTSIKQKTTRIISGELEMR